MANARHAKVVLKNLPFFNLVGTRASESLSLVFQTNTLPYKLSTQNLVADAVRIELTSVVLETSIIPIY